MMVLASVLGVGLILVTLWEGFETMVLPRRVIRSIRSARLFYRVTWQVWRTASGFFHGPKARETFRSLFGPLSLLTLFVLWVFTLVLGFALFAWGLQLPLRTPEATAGFFDYAYFSGVTFFTLGYGDVLPTSPLGRTLSVIESGMGFGVMALIIGYMPVLYQAFSSRERPISLLDARAGSPPCAGQLLLRLAQAQAVKAAEPLLAQWEGWAAELLESHLSFPVLAYYRSQHNNQSWLAALTVILDTSALILAALPDGLTYQARLTFAMARHAAVDLALIFQTPPLFGQPERLPPEKWAFLQAELLKEGLPVLTGAEVDAKLAELRGLYEPFLAALGEQFVLTVPPFLWDLQPPDNWQTTAWTGYIKGIKGLPLRGSGDRHFD